MKKVFLTLTVAAFFAACSTNETNTEVPANDTTIVEPTPAPEPMPEPTPDTDTTVVNTTEVPATDAPAAH